MSGRFAGIIAAVLTPFDERGTPDARRAIPYYHSLLARGCSALNVLGTTGEAMSIGLRERLRFMEELADDLPVSRCMVGTGASALADAVTLTRAAFDLEFGGALVIPPFYYRQAGDAGVLRFYEELFTQATPREGRVLLYNFPEMSGVTLHAALVDGIVRSGGGCVGGIKDSSNDAALEGALRAAYPEMGIFPGSEESLLERRALGISGCISGSVALWPELAAQAWESGDAQLGAQLRAKRATLGRPLLTAVRAKLAKSTGDDAWLRSLPPL